MPPPPAKKRKESTRDWKKNIFRNPEAGAMPKTVKHNKMQTFTLRVSSRPSEKKMFVRMNM
jgi:hypothetical protein